MMNGMDRVMHLSFVTTAPRHEGGQGIAMEMSCFFTFILLLMCVCGGGTRCLWYMYIGKKSSVRKTSDCMGNIGGFTNWLSPTVQGF